MCLFFGLFKIKTILPFLATLNVCSAIKQKIEMRLVKH